MVGIICPLWSRNCLPFWNTWVYPWFLLNILVEFMWFILSNHMSSLFLVPCCDVRYDFSVKTMFASSLVPFVLPVVYIFSNPTGVTCWAGIANLSGHLISTPDFSRIRVARCLFFCAMFCTSLFVLCFGHFIACPSIYSLWLPLSSFDLRSLIAPFVSSSFSLPCKEPQTIIPNELFAIGNFWYFRDIGLWELLYCFTRREHDTFCTRGVNNVQSSSCTASRRPSRLVLQATETLCLISILLYSFRIDLDYLVCN